MQQLDDDMDELFRDAAARYPLKTDGQDWNAVMGRLQPPANAVPVSKSRNKGNRFLWLLLVAPLFFIAHLPELGSGIPHLSTNKDTVIIKQYSKTIGKTGTAATTAGTENVYMRKPSTETAPVQQTVALQKAGTGRWNRFQKPDEVVLPGAVQHSTGMNRSPGAENNSNSTGNTASLPPVATTSEKNDTISIIPAASNATDSAAKPVIIEKKQPAKKGWYAGIVVSPDISTVKWQQTGKLGYGTGVLIGYRISKRIAVETGLLWDRKYYNSKGEYFDTKKIPGTNNWKITEVDGWCRMFEIPLHARYFFSTRAKSSWYLNGGLSSYIMNRESYDYSYNWNNNPVVANRAYDNATRNWFSIIHAGIGYERTIGAKAQLRVEPYLKIPAGGLGIGNLPVTSLGLNIGITRSFR